MDLLKKVWPEWTVVEKLGEGGFGQVFKIKREDMGGTYYAALKVITIPKNQSEVREAMTEGMDEKSATSYFQSIVEELVKEFALMEKLKGNTNIVSYEDHKVVTSENGIGWHILIRMELLKPLSSVMNSTSMNEAEVKKLGIDICKALELCEYNHVIHRDIKPDNIFVSDMGDYKLGDFGIARTVEKTTSNMSKKGTYSYMAPEVYKGERYDKTVDLYALGIVLYRLLNDYRLPFMPPAPRAVTFQDKENAQEARLSGKTMPNPAHAGEAFSKIIFKACAFDKKMRYQSAAEMRKALEKLDTDGSVETSMEEENTIDMFHAGIQSGNAVLEELSQTATEHMEARSWEEKQEQESSATELSDAKPSDAELPDSGSQKKSRKKGVLIGGIMGASVAVLVLCLLIFGGREHQPVVQQDSGLSAADEDTENDSVKLEKGVLKMVERDGFFGYEDADGNEIVPIQYDFVGKIRTDDSGMKLPIRVLKDGKFGFADPDTGELTVACEYDWAQEFANGCAVVGKNDGYGYINAEGSLLTELRYTEVKDMQEDKATGMCYGIVCENGRYGCVDGMGAVIADCNYDLLYDFSEGYACFVQNEKYGFIDSKGNMVIPVEYDEAIFSFSEGLACVKKDGLWGFVDEHGNTVIDFQYEAADYFKQGLAYVRDEKNGIAGYIDKNGSMVLEFAGEEAWSFEDEQIACVKQDGKWGYIDKNGAWVIEPEYEELYSFMEGYAIARKDGKYGWIDPEGNMVVPFEYEMVGNFADGEAAVQKDGKWGGIDINNEIITPFIYDSRELVSIGLAKVAADGGGFDYVNRAGKVVLHTAQ